MKTLPPATRQLKANSLTRRTPQRYAAGMRTYLLPLAVVTLLALVGPTSAELDGAGITPAKAKTTQSSGATFSDGMRATRPARRGWIVDEMPDAIVFLGARPLIVRAVVNLPSQPANEPIIKNPSNIPRPKR
jgi:hypothetical protein